ncbi:3'(2'),5'-bisphosphate nucleotidase CysQ [Desertivirga xinjiangensis]|uniref:3'(2'),5'-bisphosphate nucleotidase CysQ n=1 Tax=Desertivirga xinjiangensis TaxID=539206 RepID=UPI002108AE0A|nr:3'(2'),5'-bisphosphate nucleotidase CysQ [Pedobacter xinjiangensis]
MKPEIKPILKIAVEAGKAIMSVYGDEEAFSAVTYKEDSSPLTVADKLSHNIIAKGLSALYPDIPVLSEEGSDIEFQLRKDWEYYWCVDPLDGTKEFINRNGEFTVNIALIHRNHPVLGVIYIPCQNLLYYADASGCFKQTPQKEPIPIKADLKAQAWIALGSRSHSDTTENDFLRAYPVTGLLSAGSSLKFCLIAEGKAHIYYRKGPTMEWDTAAGHAIALSSGAIFTNSDGTPFLYNKPSLKNGSFVCQILAVPS